MSTQLAAIDLGSNSFHMIVAQLGPNQRLNIVDRIKEPVRLAAGLDASGNITAAAADRALSCLGQFAERLAAFKGEHVRAVGTNTLRKARNRLDFLELAQDTLGHRIDIIPGTEEARLIYAGVGTAFDLPGRRLVIDIGGGSTELILGAQQPEHLTSRFMGCVSWSERFFSAGVSRAAMEEAINAARQQLGGVMRGMRDAGWDHALGSSGTVKAIEAVLMQSGMTSDGITLSGLEDLAAHLIKLGKPRHFQMPGLPEHRRPVIAGGLAILLAAFRSLHIQNLTWVNAALKEGLLVQMLGSINQQEDIRAAAVARLSERLEVDQAQAIRVLHSARGLFAQVAPDWQLSGHHRRLLDWAAMLHEAGQFINHSAYHKHGAYLLANADLPGFSRQVQSTLAATVLGHRGKLSRERIRSISPSGDESIIHLSILLRIATMIHRTRSIKPPPEITIRASNRHLHLSYPSGWLPGHPLTCADLSSIADRLSAVGYQLTWS